MTLKRLLFAFLAGLGITVALSVAPAAVAASDAHAASPTSAVDVHAAPYDPQLADDEINSRFVRSGYLPINRWFLSSSVFHDRFGEFVTDQISEKMQRNWTQASGMMLGNTSWFLTGEITRSAVDFDILNVAGEAIDNAAGAIGKAIVGTPMLAGTIVVLLIGGILWSAFRRNGGFAVAAKQIVGSVIVIALVGVMSAAALNSRTVGDQFVPGVGSPGWLVKTVSDSVSKLAAVPATAFSNLLQDNEGVAQDTDTGSGGPLSCAAFQNGLKQRTSMAANADIGAVTNIVNSIWTVTGVETWKVAQFGAENDYADYMYCRLLEQNSPVSTPASQQTVTKLGAGLPIGAGTGHLTGVNPADSPVFNPLNRADRDTSLIAWAACRPTTASPSGPGDWRLAPGWASVHDPAISTKDCSDWWGAKNGADLPDNFDFGGSAEDVQKRTDDKQVLNFVRALHGNDVMAGTTAVTAYQVSAGLMLIIFGGISLLVMGAKIFMLAFMMILFVVMIASLFSRNSTSEKLGQLAAHFLGISVFSFGITLVLSVIALITKILIDFGITLWGAGNPISLVWSGVAPIVACIVLHQIFKKVLKVPSPMTPAGAFGWGAAGAAAGSAITNSFMGRMSKAPMDLAKTKGKQAMNSAADKLTGGLVGGKNNGRRQTMDGGLRTGVAGTASGQADLVNAKGSPQSKRDLKRAARVEVLEARAAHRARTGQTATGLERAGGATRRGIGALTRSTADVTRRYGGKVALGVAAGASAIDGYLSSDVAGRKALREARFGTPEQRAARREAIQSSMRDSMQKGLAALNTAKARTADTLRGAPIAIAGAAQAAPDALRRGIIGARDQAVTAGSAVARDANALGGTARLLANYAKENPADALNHVQRVAWNGTKAAAAGTGQALGALGRGAATAGAHAAHGASTVAKAATSKPVREAAKYTLVGLAAVSGPVGTVGAAAYLTKKATSAARARRERDAQYVQELRAEKAAAAKAQEQANSPKKGAPTKPADLR